MNKKKSITLKEPEKKYSIEQNNYFKQFGIAFIDALIYFFDRGMEVKIQDSKDLFSVLEDDIEFGSFMTFERSDINRQMNKAYKKKKGDRIVGRLVKNLELRSAAFHEEMNSFKNETITIEKFYKIVEISIKYYLEKTIEDDPLNDKIYLAGIIALLDFFNFLVLDEETDELDRLQEKTKEYINSIVNYDFNSKSNIYGSVKFGTSILIFTLKRNIKDLLEYKEEADLEIVSLNTSLKESNNYSKNQDSQVKILTEKVESLIKNREFQSTTLNQKNSEIRKLGISLEDVTKELEEIKKDNGELLKIKEKIDSGNLQASDGKFWEEISIDLDNQNQSLRQENAEKHETMTKQSQYIEILEKRIKSILETSFDKVSAYKIKCEQSIDMCGIDDMLGYITYSNFPIHSKQQAGELVLKLIDIISDMTTKGASSSTNVQSASEKGKGGGAYANNFLKPVLNHLKGYSANFGTQAFLEYITHINWKKLLEDCRGADLENATSKKQKISKLMYHHLTDDKEYPFIGAFEFLSEKLKEFSYGDVDLDVLATNLRESLKQGCILNDLKTIISKK